MRVTPEGNAKTRLSLRGGGEVYFYCNKHGLMKTKIKLSTFAYCVAGYN